MSTCPLSSPAQGSVPVATRWLRRALALTLAAALAGPIIGVGPGVGVEPIAYGATSSKPAGKGKSKGKGKGSKGMATQIELTRTLQDKGSQVQDCAVQHALDKGSNRIDIATRVTINGRGQVIDVRTSVKVDQGEGAPRVKDCVDALIKGIKFPSTEAPLVTIERNWTIATT